MSITPARNLARSTLDRNIITIVRQHEQKIALQSEESMLFDRIYDMTLGSTLDPHYAPINHYGATAYVLGLVDYETGIVFPDAVVHPYLFDRILTREDYDHVVEFAANPDSALVGVDY